MQYDKFSTRVDKSFLSIFPNMYYDKTCVVCGDSFKSARPHGKYCSLRCSNDAYILRRRKQTDKKRVEVLVCAICDAPLTQEMGKIKQYCSNACKQKAYRMREKQKS